MAIYDDILYGKQAGVARITINRPAKLNALTEHTLKELSAALNIVAGDHDVGVVVLTASGDRAFCAGGDVGWEASGGLENHDWHLGRQIVELPKPVIARVSGYAIGAGNHLAYFCDFTIAAEHSTFGQNGPRVGSPAGGYAVSHAASVLGHKRAREMWMLCRRYSAQQALQWGLINSVVALADLDLEVGRWCEELLILSPSSLRTVKASFRTHMESYMGRNVSDMVQEFAPDIFSSGEQQEGAAAFLEKRPPNFDRWR
jgi:2-ketocyclohexanecarboxyl-CoA hydrolase